MSDMTWQDVQDALKRSDIVLFPVGSTEQHSTHLPLNNDIFTSFEISKRVAEKLAPETAILVAPQLPFGLSSHHMGFPGTISFRVDTFIEAVKDVCRSLAAHGFRNIVIVNGHGGNTSALHLATGQIASEINAKVFLVEWWDLVPDVIAKLFTPPFFHACETETSMVLALDQRVDSAKAKPSVPQQVSSFVAHDFMAVGPKVYEPLLDMRVITQTGAVGDPTKASRDKGQELLDAVIERFASFIKELKRSREGPPV